MFARRLLFAAVRIHQYIWVDGVKKASSGSNVLNVNLTLGTKGRRRFDFYSYDSAGQRTAQATIYIFIG